MKSTEFAELARLIDRAGVYSRNMTIGQILAVGEALRGIEAPSDTEVKTIINQITGSDEKIY
jgi:hypothetical protein